MVLWRRIHFEPVALRNENMELSLPQTMCDTISWEKGRKLASHGDVNF